MIIHLVVSYPKGDAQNLEINKSTVTIGRHPTNDLMLEDELVSRFHAEVEWCE